MRPSARAVPLSPPHRPIPNKTRPGRARLPVVPISPRPEPASAAEDGTAQRWTGASEIKSMNGRPLARWGHSPGPCDDVPDVPRTQRPLSLIVHGLFRRESIVRRGIVAEVSKSTLQRRMIYSL
jgi:hypothetical protein